MTLRTSRKSSRRAFTLIELLVVVAIIGTMLAVAVIDIASGLDSARMRTATRGVLQISRYARTMALLKQRPATVTYSADGHISLELAASNDGGTAAAEIGPLALPVSVPKDATAEDLASLQDDSGSGTNEVASAPEDLVDESVSRSFEGISFHVEILGEDGRFLAPMATVDEGDDESTNAPSTSVTYETNGRCPAYRVTIGKAGAEDARDGLVVDVDRFGKVRVDNED